MFTCLNPFQGLVGVSTLVRTSPASKIIGLNPFQGLVGVSTTKRRMNQASEQLSQSLPGFGRCFYNDEGSYNWFESVGLNPFQGLVGVSIPGS